MIATVRSTAKTILGPRLTAYVRSLKIRNLASARKYREQLRGRVALEIGGPSEIFALGPLPIYRVLKKIDNCNYASRQILWKPDGFEPQYGQTLICEASSLKDICYGSYDCVLSSHSLEHIANPLEALYEWRRVLARDGLLLLILPHKDHTFDWQRPVTTLEHMIADYENHTAEDDLTHLDEILKLHDFSKDIPAGKPGTISNTLPQQPGGSCSSSSRVFLIECLRIAELRGVFSILSDFAPPFHIIILARRIG